MVAGLKENLLIIQQRVLEFIVGKEKKLIKANGEITELMGKEKLFGMIIDDILENI